MNPIMLDSLVPVEIPALGQEDDVTGLSYQEKQKRAHLVLRNARRYGLVLIGSCALCGSDKRIHGHHPNYDNPRLIIWLCPKCHRKTHPKRRGRPNFLSEPATTTISIERKLLQRVAKTAYGRIGAVRTYIPDAKLLAFEIGTIEKEKRRHRQFKQERIKREWFANSERIQDWIELLNTDFVLGQTP